MIIDILLLLPLLIYLDLFSAFLVKKNILPKKYLFFAFMCLLAGFEIFSAPMFYITKMYIVYKLLFYVAIIVSTIYFFKIIGVTRYIQGIEKKKIIIVLIVICLLPFVIISDKTSMYASLSFSSFQQGIVQSYINYQLIPSEYFLQANEFIYLFLGIIYEYLGGDRLSLISTSLLFGVIILDFVFFLVDTIINHKNRKGLKYVGLVITAFIFQFGYINLETISPETIMLYVVTPFAITSIMFNNKFKELYILIAITILAGFALSTSYVYIGYIIVIMYALKTVNTKNSFILMILQTVLSLLVFLSVSNIFEFILMIVIFVEIALIFKILNIKKNILKILVENINKILYFELIIVVLIIILNGGNIEDRIFNVFKVMTSNRSYMIEIVLFIIAIPVLINKNKILELKNILLFSMPIFIFPKEQLLDSKFLEISLLIPISIYAIYLLNYIWNALLLVIVTYSALNTINIEKNLNKLQYQLEPNYLSYDYPQLNLDDETKIVLKPLVDERYVEKPEEELDLNINTDMAVNTNVILVQPGAEKETMEKINAQDYEYIELYYTNGYDFKNEEDLLDEYNVIYAGTYYILEKKI